MAKFKVGDRVMRVGGSYMEMHNGLIGTINKIYPETIGFIEFKETYDIDKFELVEECKPYSSSKCLGELGGHEVYVTNNNKKSIMSKITTFAKNLTLTSDEKLLRKYGLKNECGEYTDEAEQLIQDKLMKENEVYLIEIAKGLELEEKNK